MALRNRIINGPSEALRILDEMDDVSDLSSESSESDDNEFQENKTDICSTTAPLTMALFFALNKVWACYFLLF